MMTVEITCKGCGHKFDEKMENAEQAPCPHCPSTARNVSVAITEEVAFTVYDSMRAKNRRKDLPSKDKLRTDIIAGFELHRKTGKWYKKDRVIDRDNDYYLERIVDPETGEVIRECEEKLSEHQGRGSAKPKGDG